MMKMQCDLCGVKTAVNLLWVYSAVDDPRDLSDEVKAKRSAIAELSPAAVEFAYSRGLRDAVCTVLTEDSRWGACDVCHNLLQRDHHPRELLERCRRYNQALAFDTEQVPREIADSAWEQVVLGMMFFWLWRSSILPVRAGELQSFYDRKER
jgi:hypothetical protein